MTTDTPKFRRAFTEEKFEEIVSLELQRVDSSVDMRMELHRCYAIIDAAVDIISRQHIHICSDSLCGHDSCDRYRRFMELLK